MRCWWSRGAMWCGCAAPLLAHVNLLLSVYGGAALATAARLKWDPSTYIAVREVWPRIYRAAAVTSALHGAALLLLPHLAAAAQHAPRRATRSALLYLYAAAMVGLIVGEMVFSAWLARQVMAWMQSDAALQLQDAMELRQYLKPLLQYFSRWHPLPQRIESLIQEAEADAPCNLYVAGAAGLLLALLQPLAVVLALCAARQVPVRPDTSPDASREVKRTYSGWCVWRWRGTSPRHVAPRCVTTSMTRAEHEKQPLRTAYKNGRIVIL